MSDARKSSSRDISLRAYPPIEPHGQYTYMTPSWVDTLFLYILRRYTKYLTYSCYMSRILRIYPYESYTSYHFFFCKRVGPLYTPYYSSIYITFHAWSISFYFYRKWYHIEKKSLIPFQIKFSHLLMIAHEDQSQHFRDISVSLSHILWWYTVRMTVRPYFVSIHFSMQEKIQKISVLLLLHSLVMEKKRGRESSDPVR